MINRPLARPLAWITTGLLAATFAIGGCKSKPAAVAVRNQDGSITNPDGSVTYPAGSQQAQMAGQAAQGGAPPQNGAVVNSDGSATYPANAPKPSSAVPTQTAAIPGPSPAVPAPAPIVREAPKPVIRTVPAGTSVVIRTNGILQASKSEVGDRFTGTLAQPILLKGGDVAFGRGTNVEGTVVASKGRGRFKGSGALGIQLTSIAGQRVSTSEYEKEEKGRGKRTGALVGGGTGLGAIIGGIAGGGKGALIGGLAGAGAGTAGAGFTGSHDVIIPSESLVTFSLTSPLEVRGSGDRSRDRSGDQPSLNQ